MAPPWDVGILCGIIAGSTKREKPFRRKCMRQLLTTLASAMALFAVGSLHANAMPLNDPAGIKAATEDLNIVDNVQFVWGGRRFCFYDDGWNGPGWYWCGRYLVPGIGWGGGVGFRGWRFGGFRGGREFRREGGFRGGEFRREGGFRGGEFRREGGFRGGEFRREGGF